MLAKSLNTFREMTSGLVLGLRGPLRLVGVCAGSEVLAGSALGVGVESGIAVLLMKVTRRKSIQLAAGDRFIFASIQGMNEVQLGRNLGNGNMR